jgi:hypothetical protein
LGMRSVGRKIWVEIPLGSEERGQWTISDWDKANEDQTRYGFSHFKLITSKADYTIGRRRIPIPMHNLRPFQ